VRSALCLLLLSAMVLAAFAARVVPAYPVVFPRPGEVRLLDTDSYYHLRHARFAARHFPHIQRFDVGTRYPTGERAIYAGLFDLSIATAALAVGRGSPTDEDVARVAAFAPPVLGALAFIAVYLLGRAVGGRGAGLAAALSLLLLPGEFLTRSLLGLADHHVAEVLLGLLALGGAVRCLRRSAADPLPRAWRPAALDALPLAALVLTWPGAAIHLILLGAALFLLATATVARGDDVRPLARGAARYGLGLLVLLGPAAALRPELIPDVRSFAGVLAASAALALVFPAGLLVLAGAARRTGRPVAVALAGLALVAVVALAAVRASPGAAAVAHRLLDPKATTVVEHGGATWTVFWRSTALPGALALLAGPLALGAAVAGRDRRLALLPVAFGGLFTALWFRTHDYGYMVPPLVAVMAVAAIALARDVLPARGGRLRWLAALALLAGTVLPIWPLGLTLSPWPPRDEISRLSLLDEAMAGALRWLEARTPAPTLPADARVDHREGDFRYPPGAYGVMAAWDLGHFVAAVGKRPPVVSGGPDARATAWLLLEDEDESLRHLDAGCEPGERVAYCIVDARTANDLFGGLVRIAGGSPDAYLEPAGVAHVAGRPHRLLAFGERYWRTLVARLYFGDGSGLGRYRLVYRSRQRSFMTFVGWPAPGSGGERLEFARRSFPIDTPRELAVREDMVRKQVVVAGDRVIYRGTIAPTVKIFERVEGARLVGSARPGATVTARLDLRSRLDGAFLVYTRQASADDSGRFEIVVAYPTGPAGPAATVEGLAPYEVLESAAPGAPSRRLGRAEASEAQVRTGAVVAVEGAATPDGDPPR